jgi:glycosyltransferase involved in cell wall biosynthesis
MQALPETASRTPKATRTGTTPDLLLIGFVGGLGGASTVMAELAVAMRARGLAPRIVVPAWDSTRGYAEACRARGIHVDRTTWLHEREPRALAYLDAFRLAARYRAPVVHYHLATTGRYVPALRLMKPPRLFATLHDPYDGPPPDSPSARRWAAVAPQLFDRVISGSRLGVERQIRYGLPRSLVQVIYNGVDIERFGSGDGARARAQLGLRPAVPLVVVSSRVAPQKRPLDALAAFARVAATLPEPHLVFVGEGPLLGEVREAAAGLQLGDRVHFTGQQFNIPDWLDAATAWLLPTESEGFSLAVIEALAAGCPIVSTICPGNEEVLVDGENGLLTDVGDVDGLAAALGRILSDADLRRRLSAKARGAAERFSMTRMADAHLQLYTDDGV